MLSGLIGIHGGRQQQAKSTSVPSLPNRGWNFVVEQLAKQRMSKLCPTGRIGFEHAAPAKGIERAITGFVGQLGDGRRNRRTESRAQDAGRPRIGHAVPGNTGEPGVEQGGPGGQGIVAISWQAGAPANRPGELLEE